MKVIVAGATGAIGRPLVQQLIDGGHEVVGITRTTEGAKQLRAAGAEAVVADVMDREALLAATGGIQADAVIHELTDLRKPPARFNGLDSTNRLRSEGSANLLEVARRAGARKFLTQSIFFGYGYADRGDTVLTEDAPFGVHQGLPSDAAMDAMVSAEQQAQSVPGIDGIALRYGLFYGGDGPNYAASLRRRALPVPTGRRGTLALIHVEDAASATVAALERGRPGAYNIVDDRPATWRELIESSAERHGAPKPLALPGRLLKLVAPYAGLMMTGVNLKVSNAKAKAELGWAPKYPSFREGLGSTASPPS